MRSFAHGAVATIAIWLTVSVDEVTLYADCPVSNDVTDRSPVCNQQTTQTNSSSGRRSDNSLMNTGKLTVAVLSGWKGPTMCHRLSGDSLRVQRLHKTISTRTLLNSMAPFKPIKVWIGGQTRTQNSFTRATLYTALFTRMYTGREHKYKQ